MIDVDLGKVGGLFTSLREAITGEKIEDKAKMLKQVSELESTFLETQGKIITAEANSEHWLVSAWRPITMLTFVFIVASNYIIAPYASALFSVTIPTLALTPEIWELIKLGLGGYVIGRSAEKVAKHLGNKGK